MMRIGILYIAIGRYASLWQRFYDSCEQFFIPDSEKHYFVFTDNECLLSTTSSAISMIEQDNLGWPGNSLWRFRMFCKIEKRLRTFDYLFFFNANNFFVDTIEAFEMLPSDKEELVGLYWKNNEFRSANIPPYEKNPESCAFVAADNALYYFQGSMNGGKADAYLSMLNECRQWVEEDFMKGIIAVWHDESYLNKYLLQKQPRILDSVYGFPEAWKAAVSYKILHLDKNKIWGEEYMYRFKYNKDYSQEWLCVIKVAGDLEQQCKQYNLFCDLKDRIRKNRMQQHLRILLEDRNKTYLLHKFKNVPLEYYVVPTEVDKILAYARNFFVDRENIATVLKQIESNRKGIYHIELVRTEEKMDYADVTFLINGKAQDHLMEGRQLKWLRSLKNVNYRILNEDDLQNEITVIKTPWICFWNPDLFPESEYQLLEALRLLRSGEADAVYPYQGAVEVLVPHEKEQWLSTGRLPDKVKIRKQYVSDWENVFVDRQKYLFAGKANIRILNRRLKIDELFKRMEILEYKIVKLPGKMFSLHTLSEKVYDLESQKEYLKICCMSQRELQNYIRTWM